MCTMCMFQRYIPHFNKFTISQSQKPQNKTQHDCNASSIEEVTVYIGLEADRFEPVPDSCYKTDASQKIVRIKFVYRN